MKSKWLVITTINPPTPAIKVVEKLCHNGWSAVVVGDTKTPQGWSADGIHFLSVDRQREIFGDFANMLPFRHYSRKNLGYLYAFMNGADCVLDTDDDNIPYSSFGEDISVSVTGRLVKKQGWVNIYKYFSDQLIWPRGLPLDEIDSIGDIQPNVNINCPVQQFLADKDPDVDAIYRLIFKDPVIFKSDAEPLILAEGTWSPLNSQNTFFCRDAFPLLYLPSNVSFRLTDIWRSFIIQGALWIHGHNVAIKKATMEQQRNPHNLMRDFEQEVGGYLNNKKISDMIDEARKNLSNFKGNSIGDTAHVLWSLLIKDGLILTEEEKIIAKWFEMANKFLK